MVKSKLSLITAILFAVMCFNIYPQTSNNSTDANSIQSFEETPFGSTVSPVTMENGNSGDAAANTRRTRGPSLLGTVIQMIVMLALVIAAIYGLMLFFKKKNNITKSDDDFLRRVSTLNLAPNKSVEIITLLDKGYLIGVTEGGINLISEIDDAELVESLNLNFDKKNNTTKPYNFKDVLEMFTRAGKKTSAFDEAEAGLDNMARRNSNQDNEEVR